MKNKILDYFTNLWYSIFRFEYEGVSYMRGKFSALDIANWLIWKNAVRKEENENENECEDDYENNYEVYEGLSHLKLQKLLYYAQGVYLSTYGKPLFNEKIVAWEHGPVVKEVYNIYKKYGRDDIPTSNDSKVLKKIEEIELDSDVSNVLNAVYDNFGIYTAWQLRQMTHIPNGPWETTVREKGMNKEISISMIKEYFKENIVENG